MVSDPVQGQNQGVFALADALGDMAYIVRLQTKAEIDTFFKFVTE